MSLPRRRQHVMVFVGLGLLLGAGLWLATAATVQAQATTFSVQSIGSKVGLNNADLRQTIINAIKIALGLLSLAAVAYLIYGGIVWMTAAGNEARIEKAKQIILQALIGVVIILLAWAIVLFVVKTVATATRNTNEGGGPCIGPGCTLTTVERTFDVTAITTCASRPNYNTAVPLSSRVAVIYNGRPKPNLVEAAVTAAAAEAKLIVEKCQGGDCAMASNRVVPTYISPQLYSGLKPIGSATNPRAEWVANKNSTVFYHTSFSDAAGDPKNKYFEADQTFRLSVPRKGADTALRDQNNRPLEECQQAPGQPIEGDSCVKDVAANLITWQFQTAASSADVNGPPLQVKQTFPAASDPPNRNVSRKPIIGIEFTNAIDPILTSLDNLQVYKFTTPPSANGTGGVLDPNPLPATMFDFDINPTGTGVWMGLIGDNLFEAFTWYKVVAKDFQSLCGRPQDPNPYEWVFETNDRAPGVRKLYPRNNFSAACPDTKVFIQFNTSMWKPGGGCDVSLGYVSQGQMVSSGPAHGRLFDVIDPVPPSGDPNNYCLTYAFTPESKELKPGVTYHLGVDTSLPIDQNGTTLVVGDKPPASRTNDKPWSFTVAPADKCYQEPVITALSPDHGPNGACVSVIGDYFTTPTDPNSVPDPGDELKLDAAPQSTILSWEKNAIVTTVDQDGLAKPAAHGYTVAVKYPDPIGTLTSDPESFYLDTGDPSNGPCLASLSPKTGPAGTTLVTAKGIRFGDYDAGQSRVLYDRSPDGEWDFPASRWTTDRIDTITVKASSAVGPGLMSVANAVGQSNALPFTVSPPDVPVPGAPQIDESTSCNLDPNNLAIPSPNPKRNDTNVCLNIALSARFKEAVDPATLIAANITLTKEGSSTLIPAASFSRHPDNKGFTFTPPNLDPNTTYVATITTNIKSPAPGSVPLARPYVWQFTAQNGNTPCPIAGLRLTHGLLAGTPVKTTSSSYTFQQDPYAIKLQATPLGADCRELNISGLTYAWSASPTGAAEIRPPSTTDSAIAASPAAGPTEASTKTWATAQNFSSNKASITYDSIACSDSSQCAKNSLDETCPGSACVSGKCTPVVNGFDPAAGAETMWTTIKGCWFGGYVEGQSTVTFKDNKQAPAPDTAICGQPGDTWRNSRIVRVVPTGAQTGPVVVRRYDSATAQSSNDFTVDPTRIYPGLCRLNPTRGPVGTALIAKGARFGANQGAGDKATLTPLVPPQPAVDMSTYAGWADNEVKTQIPTAPLGGADVRVIKSANPSNPLDFTVRSASASCAAYCSVDTDCTAAGEGCGTDNCCHPRPKIVAGSFRPATNATNVCRNAVSQVTFDQPLDGASVTTDTVRQSDGYSLTQGKVSLSNRDNQGTITYAPGVLSPNAKQTFELRSLETLTTNLVANPSFEDVNGSGQIDKWDLARATQSSDRPPNHTGQSVLVDCTSNCGASAYAFQDIPATAGKSLRITGWVKVEQPSSVKSGLITQCQGLWPCPYDLINAAPGLITGSSGGWKHLDFVVTAPASSSYNLHLNCFARVGAKVWCDDVSVTEVTTGPTAIRSDQGVLADVTGSPNVFTTGPDICQLDRVVITPDSWSATAAGETQPFSADAFSNRDRQTPLQGTPGYDWTWKWKSNNEGLVKLAPDNAATTTVTAQNKNGRTTIEARAKVTSDGRERAAQADVSVGLCENPWSFADSAANCDTGGPCQSFHFGLSYCRDNGTVPLPDFSYHAIEGQNLTDATRLKSYFFKENVGSRDTIGMLIFDNPDFLSPADWYAERFPSDRSVATTTVAGYPAVKTGTTTYIGVTDFVPPGQLRGIIVVLDYNSNNAAAETKTIYNKLLAAISFNRGTGLSSTEKEQLIRDTKRRQDAVSLSRLLTTYKTSNGAYPTLQSGSFLIGMSTSRWPSWTTTLGNLLGRALPVDPQNTFSTDCTSLSVPGAATYENSTCWSEARKAFQCPADSHLYAYEAAGTGFKLYANMEYGGPGSFATGSVNPCSGRGESACSCFNYTLSGS